MDLEIIEQIRNTFEDLPDHCKTRNNRNYALEDAPLALSRSSSHKAHLFWTISNGYKNSTIGTMRNRFLESIKFFRPAKSATCFIPLVPETFYLVLAAVSGQLTLRVT
jgi:hypothetical protein